MNQSIVQTQRSIRDCSNQYNNISQWPHIETTSIQQDVESTLSQLSVPAGYVLPLKALITNAADISIFLFCIFRENNA